MPSLVPQLNAADFKELEAYMTQVNSEVESLMGELLPEVDESDESRLFEAMRYSAFSGGKRLRPMLIMAANEVLGGQEKRALHVAAAMEFMHTYSLIHDDLPCMDDDDLRRGKPTCHKKFDETTAILAGDSLQTLAFEVLSMKETHPDPSTRVALVNLFAKAAGAQGMAGGQMLDMIAENKPEEDVDQGALARLQRKKTGALFSACCESAVLLNGSTREEHHRLASYARNLGLAFQMIDDVLDVTGDSQKLGQEVGRDAAAGKTTFASLLGAEGAQRQAEFLLVQAVDYLNPFGSRARMLDYLARFIAHRDH